ncbi:MAG: tyrosine-type recombinase/integrase [Acidimicrobiales bacterium]
MIKQRGGRWRVVVQAGRDPITGKRQQLSGSAASERDAVRLERQLRLQVEGQIGGSITLAKLVGEWWGSGPDLAPTTLLNYRGNLDNHILPVLGDRKVTDVRPRLIAAFLRHLEESKGLEPATLRKVRTVLSAVMSYAAAMEYVESNPVARVPPPKGAASSGVAPTVEETARLLLTAEAEDPDLLTFLWVAAEEGGRRGEVLGLRWRDVDLDNKTLTISQTISTGEDGVQVRPTTKADSGRTIAVSAITAAHLAEHRSRVEERLASAAGAPVGVRPDALVFSGGRGSRRTLIDGRPWRPESTSRRFRLLKERAKVRAEIDLHGLRRTMITELIAVGVDPRTVMGRAGHRSEATTMTIYAKVRPVVDAAAAEMWGQILNDKLTELRAAVLDEVADDVPVTSTARSGSGVGVVTPVG